MKRIFQIFVIIFLSLNINIPAQSIKDSIKTEKQLTVLTGVNFWENGLFAEIGVAKYTNKNIGYHLATSAYFLSTEINILTGKDFIIGPKIGGWISGGAAPMAMGANLIYYTNFKNSNLYFRPEIGFGLMRVKVVYGYNVILTKNRLEGIPKSNIGIVYLIPAKKK